MQIHTNGDAATDMLVKAIATVRNGKPRPDLRTVIIHDQTMREDQLDFAKQIARERWRPASSQTS